MSALISLDGVGVRYQRRTGLFGREPFWALRDVSFDLMPGDALGVIGRNGAGKTTLLQLLARIIDPDRGVLRNRGARTFLLSLQLGFIPQLSGRVNAVMSGMLMGMSRRQMSARMDRIVQFAELEEFIDQPVHSYSAGMRARLGFAVALELDTDVVLIDEVLGVGDLHFRQKSTAAMREKLTRNRAVVIVSHEPNLLEELTNRTVWIEHGVTQQVGDTRSVLARYREAALGAVSP